MNARWKGLLALCLCVLMVLGCFTACGGEKPEETKPAATEPAEEAKVLKVLTLGHSLANDAGYMLNLIADAEGYEEMLIGTLYYSGCPLVKHVEYLTKNSPEYILYISSTETPDQPPEGIENATMYDALRYEYWDIVVMQGGVFEIAEDATYKTGHIQTIQKYVKENTHNPNVKFMWNMAWAPPVDEDLRNTKGLNPDGSNGYTNQYEKFNNDRTNFYNAMTKAVGDNIVTDDTFTALIPSGTVFENALSSYLSEKDMHRDYVHATDLARVMVSYTWFCRLTGVDQLTEIKLDVIPKRFFKSTKGFEDRVLTENEKALILETVNNALKNPLQMTQSQYTEAPADYVPVTLIN